MENTVVESLVKTPLYFLVTVICYVDIDGFTMLESVTSC